MFPSSQPQVASLEDIVREEVQRSLNGPEPTQPQPEAMTYAALHAELPPLLADARTQYLRSFVASHRRHLRRHPAHQ